MAEEKKKKGQPKVPKLRKPAKKVQTVRERSTSKKADKPKRIRTAAGKASKPISKAKNFGKQEYHLPLPNNKAGRILGKKVRLVPKFFTEAVIEIRQVTWPNRKDTISLTFAVFVFAIVFSSFVGILDYTLGELFQKFIVNNNK